MYVLPKGTADGTHVKDRFSLVQLKKLGDWPPSEENCKEAV